MVTPLREAFRVRVSSLPVVRRDSVRADGHKESADIAPHSQMRANSHGST